MPEKPSTTTTANPFAKLRRQRPVRDARQSGLVMVEEAFSASKEARNDVLAEAYRLRLNPQAFSRWLRRQVGPWYSECDHAISEAAKQWDSGRQKPLPGEWKGWAQDVVSAVERLTRNLEALKIPPSLRGRTRGRSQDSQSLLKQYEKLVTKSKTFLREDRKIGPDLQIKLWGEFPEANLEDLELLEQRKPAAFVKAVLARQTGLSTQTIHKRLIEARKRAGTSRPKSRLA